MSEPAEIAPGVFIFTAEQFTTTTTVVAGVSGGCLVIDPAVTVADIAALASWLAERGLRAVAGWSTHPHWDHVLWSAALGADVPRYATPSGAAVAVREHARLVSAVEAAAPGHDLSLFGELTPLAGDVIPWEGPEARVITHDAHAPGHGAVFLPDTGVLATGDMCSDIEIPLPDMNSGDPFGTYRKGLGLLAAVPDVRVVVPGHGHAGDSAALRSRIAADYAYLDAVEAGVSGTGDSRLSEDWLRAEHARHLTWRPPS
jgi:hydroxyacylglutathione hydrolase